MKKDHMQYDVRKARIYKDNYRPSSKLSRFFGTIFSVLINGQSPVGSSDAFLVRKSK